MSMQMMVPVSTLQFQSPLVKSDMPVPPTIFVVDDDKAAREALSLSLSTRGLSVISFESAEAFLQAYQSVERGCLVLDVRLGGMSGLELQDALAVQNIRIPLIFITGHGDVPMSVRAIKNGAIDFLEKPFATAVLLQRIEEALAEQALTHRAQAKQHDIQRRFDTLTKREKDVFAHLVSDPVNSSNKRVAAVLGVSHRTIEHHRANIMAKMKAKSLTDLVTMTTKVDISCCSQPLPSDL